MINVYIYIYIYMYISEVQDTRLGLSPATGLQRPNWNGSVSLSMYSWAKIRTYGCKYYYYYYCCCCCCYYYYYYYYYCPCAPEPHRAMRSLARSLPCALARFRARWLAGMLAGWLAVIVFDIVIVY